MAALIEQATSLSALLACMLDIIRRAEAVTQTCSKPATKVIDTTTAVFADIDANPKEAD
jgi:hypothetical protein